MYYKITDASGKVVMVCKGDNKDAEPISEEEYKALQEVFMARSGKVQFYVQQVQAEIISVEDVPAEYYEEVHEILNQPVPEAPNQYGISNSLLQQIQDDTVAGLIELGVL